MSHPTLIRAEDAVLVVVDMQQKLLPAINCAEDVCANVRRLILGAKELGVPIVVSEQYPKGLGPTDERITEALDEAKAAGADVRCVEKTTFSCTETEEFVDVVEELARDQVILCGVESHVCVLQTALGLVEEGSMTFVVADAVSSRVAANRMAALERMRQAGVVTPVTESVLFEMLVDARHPAFKAISALIR